MNLTIEPGERIAIIGPNGAGKSTLLQIMAGLIAHTDGELRLFDQAIDRKSVESTNGLLWLRSKLGIVFQDSDIALFNSSVWGDVTFGPLHQGLTKDEVEKRSMDALNALGIAHLKDRPPHRLSGGEKRKVSIACVLSIHPEVILFDEPTSDLDPSSRKVVIDILKRLSAEGKTIIVATHDVNAVPDFADRIIVLKKKVVASGKVREVLSDDAILKSADLEVPEVTRLFKVLSRLGYSTSELPFSLDEAAELIMRKEEAVGK